MSDYYGHGGGAAGGASAVNTNAASTNTAAAGATADTATNFKNYFATHKNIKASKAPDQCKIFVGGLSWQTTEESLRWHFEQYGQVVSVEVMRDRNTGDPRGFAFVVFNDPAVIDLVMADKDKHEINHKLVDVKRAQARGIAPPSIHEHGDGQQQQPPQQQQQQHQQQQQQSFVKKEYNNNQQAKSNEPTPEQLQTKVFVGGIPPQIDRDELKQIFSQFGPVVDSIVMLDPTTQRSRCFGFVTFENGSNGAQNAIAKQPLQIQGRHVEVKLATPRAEQTGGGNANNNNNNNSHGGGHYGNNKMSQNQHPDLMNKRTNPAAAQKHLGLRAGKTASTGEYAGLAVAYGRSGWKAGYGTKAFGKAGWAVDGWEDTGVAPPERAGFSFDMLIAKHTEEPPSKRSRH